MPNIAEKSKVFGGKGVVLSFTRAPDVFLYRELIPGTKKYRYKVIDGANTLEAAIDKSLDVYNPLRSEGSVFSRRSCLNRSLKNKYLISQVKKPLPCNKRRG